MPKSDMAKKLNKAINAADKMIDDFVKNGTKMLEALRELKESSERKEDEEESETK